MSVERIWREDSRFAERAGAGNSLIKSQRFGSRVLSALECADCRRYSVILDCVQAPFRDISFLASVPGVRLLPERTVNRVLSR